MTSIRDASPSCFLPVYEELPKGLSSNSDFTLSLLCSGSWCCCLVHGVQIPQTPAPLPTCSPPAPRSSPSAVQALRSSQGKGTVIPNVTRSSLHPRLLTSHCTPHSSTPDCQSMPLPFQNLIPNHLLYGTCMILNTVSLKWICSALTHWLGWLERRPVY